jgi:hybrid cluster-associated redox disulfide protein
VGINVVSGEWLRINHSPDTTEYPRDFFILFLRCIKDEFYTDRYHQSMDTKITPSTTVAELLKICPDVIPLFLSRKMACVGCDMSRFETLGDAARIYRVDLAKWMQEIEQVLEQNQPAELSNNRTKGNVQ